MVQQRRRRSRARTTQPGQATIPAMGAAPGAAKASQRRTRRPTGGTRTGAARNAQIMQEVCTLLPSFTSGQANLHQIHQAIGWQLKTGA